MHCLIPALGLCMYKVFDAEQLYLAMKQLFHVLLQ